jgi:hypothetical protein
MRGRYSVGMSAQPADDADLDDPVEILRVLPARFTSNS